MDETEKPTKEKFEEIDREFEEIEEARQEIDALLERIRSPTERRTPPRRGSVTDLIDLDRMVERMTRKPLALVDGKLVGGSRAWDETRECYVEDAPVEQHFREEEALHVGTDGTLQVSTKYVPQTGFAWGVVNLVRDGMGLPEFEWAHAPKPPDPPIPPIPEPEPTSCTKDWRCNYDPDHEGACSWRGIDYSKLEVPKEGPAVSAELCGDPHVVGPREGCHVLTSLCESCGKDEAGIRVVLGDPPKDHECSDRCDRGEFVAHCQQLQGHEGKKHSAKVSLLHDAVGGDSEEHEVSWE